MLDKLKEKLSPKKEEKKVDAVEAEKETKEVEETEETTETNEVEETSSEDGNEEQAENQEEETVEEPQVTETEDVGNGIRVEDLVTKSELTDKLASFEAKLDAVLKENADLKEQNSQIKEKYEEKDFGNVAKKGTFEKDASTEHSSYEEYAKQFK